MRKPLKEHYEVETDAGIMHRMFDYANDLEKYIDHLEKQLLLHGVSKSFYCQQAMGIGGKQCETQCEYCKEDQCNNMFANGLVI